MLTPMPSRRPLRVLVAFVVVVGVLAALAPAAAATTYTFTGRGWGHGLGMSQWGARGLAEKGNTASQILKRYYKGTAIETKSLPATIRVGLLQERNEIWVEGSGAFDLYDKTGARKASGGVGERWRIVPNADHLDVFRPNDATTPVFSSGVPVTVGYESKSTDITLPQTGYDYRHGQIEVDINPSTGKTRAVLEVAFEKYLYGLGEMPSSWPTEAIEAQAIAGRTYALEKVSRLGDARPVCNCAVYASTADQAYVGLQHEVPLWVAAVDATAGQVVTYAGKPIQAYYSSSSGGFTENNENIFGGAPLAYLRGVCDPGDYFNNENPHNAWSVTAEDTQIEQKLNDAGYKTGPVLAISFLEPRGVSGRVLSVKDDTHGGVLIDGALSDARLSGSAFRSLLGMKSTLIFHHIIGTIRLRYDALNCSPGLPRGAEFSWKNLDGTVRGRAQTFANGRLFFDATTNKVLYTKQPILAKYDALREAKTDFGLPTSDQVTAGSGVASMFEKGNIYYSKATAAHEVHGAILTKFLKSGGPGKWGLPTTDELKAPNDGKSNRFQKARIYWTSEHGAHVLYGSILKAYLDRGGGSSRLGLPISDEYGIDIGRRVDFEHGYITWNRTTNTTDYKVT
jgi:SpoIID/LytB domain protein